MFEVERADGIKAMDGGLLAWFCRSFGRLVKESTVSFRSEFDLAVHHASVNADRLVFHTDSVDQIEVINQANVVSDWENEYRLPSFFEALARFY